MGRPLSRDLSRPVVEGLALATLTATCLLPLLAVGAELFGAGAWTQLSRTLGDRRAWELLGRTLALAGVVTAGTIAVGVPAGLLLGRTDLIGRRVALWIHGFGLFLPPFVLALGWFYFLGQVAPWARSTLLGPGGVVAVLVLSLSPIVTALILLGTWGIDPSLEEAALAAAPPWRVLRSIVLPLTWRPIALAALLVFALASSEIGVPMFLGVRTYSGAVFARLGGMAYAPGEAFALVLPLMAVGAALVLVDRTIVGTASLGLRAWAPRPLPLGRARVPLSLVCWLGVLSSLLPLFGLVAQAGTTGWIDAAGWVGASATTSLVASAAAAAIVMFVGVIVAHARRWKRRGSAAADALCVLSFMVPSAVLGVGIITVYNRPSLRALYASVAILALGLSAKYAVIGARGAAAVLSQASPHAEEAAAVFGSPYLHRMIRIVVPMRARALVGIGLLAFVACLRDLDTVVMFHPPGREPFLVKLFTLEANGPEPVVAALALYQVLATAALVLVAGRMLSKRKTG